MQIFYVVASSESQAYENLFKGDHFGNEIDDATRHLKQFGRDWHSIYEIALPSPTVVVESKKIQLKKEKHNASE